MIAKEPPTLQRYAAYRGATGGLSFIRDNQSGQPVKGRDNRVRSFKAHKDAERAARKLNAAIA
jgi:hypothetical protein